MSKAEIEAEQFLDTYLGGNRNVSTLTWNHWVECLKDYGDKRARLQIEADRERVITECTEFKTWICDNCCSDSISYVEADWDKIKNLPIKLD